MNTFYMRCNVKSCLSQLRGLSCTYQLTASTSVVISRSCLTSSLIRTHGFQFQGISIISNASSKTCTFYPRQTLSWDPFSKPRVVSLLQVEHCCRPLRPLHGAISRTIRFFMPVLVSLGVRKIGYGSKNFCSTNGRITSSIIYNFEQTPHQLPSYGL